MRPLISDISYIICYREASDERRQALQFVLHRIRQYFPEIEILIVEQDAESKLELDEQLNIQHLFVQNEGLFNRSWAFNCAARHTTKNIFVFADADIFLEKEGYFQCFEATREFEAITPNKVEISNVALVQDAEDPVQFLNMRKLHSFAGGMLIMTCDAFDKIGGWDERFEGWGGEDDAMSHAIYNGLKSKTFHLSNYHIDHPHEFVAGNNQPRYRSNRALVEEILTRNGRAFDRYIQQLKNFDLGNPEKYRSSISAQEKSPRKFVLAITTYNRLNYLKECVDSFIDTRSDTFSWQLIIADDHSTDGTKEYLKELEEKHNAIIIHNDRSGIHHQVNSIIKALSNIEFDLCFRCDDDITFLKNGWDRMYWKTIQRTGYDHLIFYDKNWLPHVNLARPNQFGKLVSNCTPENIQGAFYTLTKEVIDKVGYIDEQQFGTSGLGHIDYSFRCCRAGFNVIAHPFDVNRSNEFIQLQSVQKYSSASSLLSKTQSNSKSVIAFKKQLLKMDRVYIPYNENVTAKTDKKEKAVEQMRLPKRQESAKYKKADATFYPERGIVGFFGFVMKRIYNLSIDLRLYFIPKGIHLVGKAINKISIHLLNIDQ